MKTAMQELIEWLNEIDNSIFALSAPDNELRMLKDFKSKATELLDKEKEQIKRANDVGWEDGRRERFDEEKFFKDSEDYYNKTFL